MELQEFLEDEELALGVKGEGPGIKHIRFSHSITRYLLSSVSSRRAYLLLFSLSP